MKQGYLYLHNLLNHHYLYHFLHYNPVRLLLNLKDVSHQEYQSSHQNLDKRV